MSQTRPQPSTRLQTTEAELASFHVVHGRPLHSSRRLPSVIELGAQTPQPDEVTTTITRPRWEAVKAAAAEHGCEEVKDSLRSIGVVGLTAGTSTPDRVIAEVRTWLEGPN